MTPAWRIDLEPPPARISSRLSIDTLGRFLSWFTEWERNPVVGIVDLAAGRVIHVEAPMSALAPSGFAGGFVVEDYAYLPTPSKSSSPKRWARFEVADGRVEVEAIELTAAPWLYESVVSTIWSAGRATKVEAREPPHLAGTSPDGRTLVVRGASGTSWLVDWPGLAIRQKLRPGWHIGVDWRLGRRFAVDMETRELRAEPLNGGSPSAVPWPRWAFRGSLLEHGIVQAFTKGLRLFDPVAGWTLSLLPATSRDVPAVSLAEDGFGLRTILGGRPVRFSVDLARGRLIDRPERAEYLGRARRGSETGVWHRHLDVVAYAKHSPNVHVRSLDGTVLCRLPDAAEPIAWVLDGDALLLAVDGGAALELWRMS